MKGLTVKQIGDLFREFNFNETEAAGLFRWYAFPSRRDVSEHDIPAYVRAQFYEGQSDLQIWVVRVRSNLSVMKEGFSDYVGSEADVVAAIGNALIARQRASVEELVKWSDPRVIGSPLFQTALSPYRTESLQAEFILADWLLESGVPF